MSARILVAALFAAILVTCAGCGSGMKKKSAGEASHSGESGAAGSAGAASDSAGYVVRTTVEELNASDALVGRTVLVEGRCAGWSSGVVPGGPPVTKSDWVLRDGEEGIYVAGPLPDGCTGTEGSAERITILATVEEIATPVMGADQPMTRRYLVPAGD